jgi:hypothetical protein
MYGGVIGYFLTRRETPAVLLRGRFSVQSATILIANNLNSCVFESFEILNTYSTNR